MPRFAMGDLEPPAEDVRRQLAIDAYSASGELVADAISWASVGNLSCDLIDHIVEEYEQSPQFDTHIDDMIDGET